MGVCSSALGVAAVLSRRDETPSSKSFFKDAIVSVNSDALEEEVVVAVAGAETGPKLSADLAILKEDGGLRL